MSLIMMVCIGVGLVVIIGLVIATSRRNSVEEVRLTGPSPVTVGVSQEVRRLAQEGKKIEAIKLHREQTGLGLKESKDAVDAI